MDKDNIMAASKLLAEEAHTKAYMDRVRGVFTYQSKEPVVYVRVERIDEAARDKMFSIELGEEEQGAMLKCITDILEQRRQRLLTELSKLGVKGV